MAVKGQAWRIPDHQAVGSGLPLTPGFPALEHLPCRHTHVSSALGREQVQKLRHRQINFLGCQGKKNTPHFLAPSTPSWKVAPRSIWGWCTRDGLLTFDSHHFPPLICPFR